MSQDPYNGTQSTPVPAYAVDEPAFLVEEEPVTAYPTSDPGYATPVYAEPGVSSDTGAETGTAGVAKDQAQQLGKGATDAGKQVAGVAKEQAAEVAGEAKAQASNVLSQARTEVQGQADTQKQRVAQGLHSISRELESMVDGSDEQGVASDLARQASEAVRQAASWLDDRDPGALLHEVRTFAQRRPGAFLGIALTAGVVAGRLTRGLKDTSDDSPSTATSAATATTTSPTAGGTTPPVYGDTYPPAPESFATGTDPYAGGLR